MFLVLACHGYHVAGFQEVLGAFLDKETLTHEFIPVEKIVRGYLKELKNAYIVAHFACCREIKSISDLEVDKLKQKLEERRAKEREDQLANELEESKDPTDKRGGPGLSSNSGKNLSLIFGCQSGEGISAASKLIYDTIILYMKNFDPEKGVIILPDVY